MRGYQHNIKAEKGEVLICNNSDPFYWCGFENRREVDKFIKDLEKARDTAFRKTKEN